MPTEDRRAAFGECFAGQTTNFTYTPYGAVQTVTDADNVTTTYGYDATHRLVKITGALGNYVQYTLDAAGNKTAEQVYDASGSLHRTADGCVV